MADILRHGLAWHPLEPWGCWTRPGLAMLKIPLPEGSAEVLWRVHLGCVAPPAAGGLRMRAFGADAAPGRFLAVEAEPQRRFACVLECEATEGGIIVEIDAGAGAQIETEGGRAGRAVGLGVTDVMVCRPEDLAARQDFLERQAFLVLGPA
jgi:hypothetical protein